MTTVTGTEEKQIEDVEEKDVHREKEHLWVDEKETNKVTDEINQLDNEADKHEDPTAQMTVTQALKKIKKMTEKKITT